jgi:2'-5' RNA ligase
MRIFIAIELDPPLRRALLKVPEREPLVGDGVRWVAEPLLHLTLRFVGEVEDSRILSVTQAVERATVQVPVFAMTVQGLGCFPGPAAPRIFWAGVVRCEPLMTLAERVEAELRQEGFPAEFRPFSPHITLARIRKRGVRPRSPLDSSDPIFGEQHVTSVAVVESELIPRRGPQYTVLERPPLNEG